jgi:pyrrolidone-carboxylate peptidase
MGVYQGSGRFNVEQLGKNIKHFRIPDERGNTPLNMCIDESQDITHCLKTSLAVDRFVENLALKSHNVGKSLSAGEYICNYTYFCSLKNKCEKVLKPEKVDCLFCHVPTFAEIDEPSQQRFLLDLLKEIRDSIVNGE